MTCPDRRAPFVNRPQLARCSAWSGMHQHTRDAAARGDPNRTQDHSHAARRRPSPTRRAPRSITHTLRAAYRTTVGASRTHHHAIRALPPPSQHTDALHRAPVIHAAVSRHARRKGAPTVRALPPPSRHAVASPRARRARSGQLLWAVHGVSVVHWAVDGFDELGDDGVWSTGPVGGEDVVDAPTGGGEGSRMCGQALEQ